MAQVKFTKSELRSQQLKLAQLEKYLPTLQLKKAMLQLEVNQCAAELDDAENKFSSVRASVESFAPLLGEKIDFNVLEQSEVESIKKDYENIAGVEIPTFQDMEFKAADYFLFDTPIWADAVLNKIKELLRAKEIVKIIREKKRALYAELREVSIRVNLFEKILIPRTKENIKKIKIFLGDQQLAEIAQAKVAKSKLEARKVESI